MPEDTSRQRHQRTDDFGWFMSKACNIDLDLLYPHNSVIAWTGENGVYQWFSCLYMSLTSPSPMQFKLIFSQNRLKWCNIQIVLYFRTNVTFPLKSIFAYKFFPVRKQIYFPQHPILYFIYCNLFFDICKVPVNCIHFDGSRRKSKTGIPNTLPCLYICKLHIPVNCLCFSTINRDSLYTQ